MTSLQIQDIGLRPSQLKAVARKAKSAGTTAAEYVRLLVERDLQSEALDDILQPIREDFRNSGISEDQLDKLVRRARVETRPKARRKCG